VLTDAAIGASLSLMSAEQAKSGRPAGGIRRPELVEIPIEGKDEKLMP
jgi:hypothetical protein